MATDHDLLDVPTLAGEIRRRCPSIAAPLVAGLTTGLRLVAEPAGTDAVPRGASKLGGDPDVPTGFAWPTWVPPRRRGTGDALRLSPGDEADRVPLRFVAQVDLAEAAAAGPTDPLPGTGMLWFFADPVHCTGLFPAEADGSRVLWLPDAVDLRRHPAPGGPAGSGDPLPAARVTIRPAPSLPDPVTLLTAGDVPDDEADELEQLLADVDAALGTSARHQLLGHPEGIQQPVLDEVVQAVHGCFLAPRLDVDRWERLRPEVASWQLLLQVDSDDALGLDWSGGRLYFSAERSLDRTWFTYQR